MTRAKLHARPSFLEGVGVALAASVIGAALFAVLPPLLGWEALLRVIIAGLALGYLLYLLKRSRERVGKVTVVVFWLAGAVTLWLVHVPFSLYLLAHAGAVWFVRSLYFHGGPIAAALDLALTGFGVIAAIWAMLETGSLFIALWSFFLCQALFAAIPRTFGPKRPTRSTDAPFERAHRAGQAALRALSSSQ